MTINFKKYKVLAHYTGFFSGFFCNFAGMKEDFELLLRQKIEIAVGSAPQTRRDFDRLAAMVFERTGKTLCSTTLRRFWGYQEQKASRITSPNTLNLLSRMAGARDWPDFQKMYGSGSRAETVSSNFVVGNAVLAASQLQRNRRILLTWAPDRRVEIRYKGNNVFCVLSSENSKLNAGDTFQCPQIVNGQPLYCENLMRGGVNCGDYCCGEQGGVHFTEK